MTRTVLVVREVETSYGPGLTTYRCQLEGVNGLKVSFILFIRGEKDPRWSEAPAQYAAVSPHVRKGDILSCELAYTFEYKGLIAGIVQFYKMEVRRSGDDSPLSADEYLALGENLHVAERKVGPVVLVPGRIPLNGDACVPVFGEERVKHVPWHVRHRKGLRWGRRPTLLRRFLWSIAASRRGFIVGPA